MEQKLKKKRGKWERGTRREKSKRVKQPLSSKPLSMKFTRAGQNTISSPGKGNTDIQSYSWPWGSTKTLPFLVDYKKNLPQGFNKATLEETNQKKDGGKD